MRKGWAVSGLSVAVFLAVLGVPVGFVALPSEDLGSLGVNSAVGEQTLTESFVIWTNGTHYYATDSLTDKLIYQGQN